MRLKAYVSSLLNVPISTISTLQKGARLDLDLVPTMIRCLMEAFEYFGGLSKAALTDRMKSVLLEMENKVPRWNPLFADFMAFIGVAPRVCKAYTPQTNELVAIL